jgi:XTP/dITP diphosphohydrolase
MSLYVLLTSPRVPAGLLSAASWRALDSADEVLARPGHPLSAALRADGRAVRDVADPRLEQLASAAEASVVVWLADVSGEPLLADLAAEVVRRSQSGSTPLDLEVVVGSFDPAGARLLDLVATTAALRTRCPWDRSQTHTSLLRYLIEEAYEVVDAAERGDRTELRDELGDLLWQVMFHSVIASEDPEDPWDVDDVAGAVVAKLVRRHPHVFGDVSVSGVAEVRANWEQIKRAEKPGAQIFAGVPVALPALMLADKVIGKMRSRGITTSVPSADGPSWTAEHLGDVLFALVAAAEEQGIDAESALRARVRSELEREPEGPG